MEAMPYLSATMSMDPFNITASDDDRTDDRDGDLGVATRTRTRTKTPSPYKVLMLNDDYTPMEFVVHVLQSIFKMGLEDARVENGRRPGPGKASCVCSTRSQIPRLGLIRYFAPVDCLP